MIELYGKNSCYEAIKYNKSIKKIYLLDKSISFLEYKNITEYKDKKFFDKYKKNHQGIVVLVDDYFLYDLFYIINLKKEKKRILILDGICDPQNLGAILRSVDCFSFDFVILPKNNSCPITNIVCHTSQGACEHVKICYVNSISNTIRLLKKSSFWIVSADAKGSLLADNINKDLNICLIVGSEGFGIKKSILKESDFIVRINMTGHINSLNASASCAILLEKFML